MSETKPELRQVAEQLARLIEVSITLNSTLDLDELLKFIIHSAAEILDCRFVTILLYDEKQKCLLTAAGTDLEPGQLPGIRLPLEGSLAGMIFEKNQAIVLPEVKGDPDHFPRISKYLPFDVDNFIGVPMRSKNKPTGVLEALNKQGRSFDESDADILSVIASQAAVAIHNANLVKELQDAYNELRSADQLKTNFLALASHELRTPLGVIIGYASLLQEESQGELSAHAQQVVNAALQMRSLVEAMTNLDMLRANEMILHPQNFPVQNALNTAVEEIKPSAQAKGQAMNLQLPEKPLMVSGDPAKLTAVFACLLSNSVRFTPDGGRITVGAEEHEGEILSWIQDTGIGIQAENLKKVFLEFYQVEPHTTRKIGGLGIGLTIARGLVEAHGGKIWAESAGVGKGSTFKVSLPHQGAGISRVG